MNGQGLRAKAAPEFAAMLCLYRNNDAEEVRSALRSAFDEQSYPPVQLIAVFDGPVPAAVSQVIEEFEATHPVLRIVHPECRGHGPARAAAIDACSYPWIAIIDADDISTGDRFRALCAVIADHPETAVVGGGLTEFHMENGRRVVGATVLYPETPEEVRSYIRARSPVAQPTSMLRVQAIREVGNYQSWFNNEDYHLWIRLVSAGYAIRNVRKPLLQFRTSPDLFRRRGGVTYWWNEVKLQLFSYRHGTTTLGSLFAGALVRFVVQVCMPGAMRQMFYKRVLRQS